MVFVSRKGHEFVVGIYFINNSRLYTVIDSFFVEYSLLVSTLPKRGLFLFLFIFLRNPLAPLFSKSPNTKNKTISVY